MWIRDGGNQDTSTVSQSTTSIYERQSCAWPVSTEYRTDGQVRLVMSASMGGCLPVLVADSVRNCNVLDFRHDSLGGCIHQIEGALVVGLFESIFGAEPLELTSGTTAHMRRRRDTVLCEAPAVYADDNPSVWEQEVWLLKAPDVFESVVC